MLSLISNQTRNHLIYAFFLLLGLVFASINTQAQSDDSRLVGSKEGTLIVNYWSSAPDPEVEQLRSVMVEALEMYLNGAVNIQDGDVNWRSNLRTIKKDMERLVRDLMVLRKFKEKVPFEGFSDEIDAWIIAEFSKIGLDTAKAILEQDLDDLVRRTDLEEETIREVVQILREEFDQ